MVLLENLQDTKVSETAGKTTAERESNTRPVFCGTRGVLSADWDVLLHGLRMKERPAAANGRCVLK